MKSRINLFLILFLFLTDLTAQDKLNEYIEIASKNNPGLQAKYYQYLAALEVIPQIGTLPDPQLGFGYFIQPIETRTGPQEARISLKQMFPWFGSLQSREDVQIQLAKAKFEEFESARVKISFEVKSEYYNLYFLNRSIQITTENLTFLKSLKNLSSIKVASGMGSSVDEIRIEMDWAELINQRELFVDQLKTARFTFQKLLNSDDLTIEIPDSLPSLDLELNKHGILDSIKSNNHHLKGLDHAIASYRHKESVAQKSGLPDFSVGIDYFFIGKNDDPLQNGKDAILFPNIGISIPLFRGKYNARKNEAELNTRVGINTKKEQLNKIESAFEQAYQNFHDAHRRIKLYKNQLDLAQKGTRLLETAYTTESTGLDEILQMERRTLAYSLKLEKALTDKFRAIALIASLMGK